MTVIADSIIKEYLSEVEEKLEDDKSKIMLSQAASTGSAIWRFVLFLIQAFFVNVVVVAVILLIAVDAATIDSIKTATADEVIQGISTFFSIIGTIQTLIAFLMGMFFYGRFGRDKRQERIDNDNYDAYLTGKIVYLTEEVLKRHNLVKEEVLS